MRAQELPGLTAVVLREALLRAAAAVALSVCVQEFLARVLAEVGIGPQLHTVVLLQILQILLKRLQHGEDLPRARAIQQEDLELEVCVPGQVPQLLHDAHLPRRLSPCPHCFGAPQAALQGEPERHFTPPTRLRCSLCAIKGAARFLHGIHGLCQQPVDPSLQQLCSQALVPGAQPAFTQAHHQVRAVALDERWKTTQDGHLFTWYAILRAKLPHGFLAETHRVGRVLQ
mmetsp:Transcript_93986/g.223681  ORF Transcript_93986/g.223681 Transcript_93986/m.223681 type:complete len:229 (-) Transcript_93986:319-1005(-)